jgi:hypothetical protein
MIEYLHCKPVRQKMIARAEVWASAQWYTGIRPVPIAMDGMVLEELSREGPRSAERFACNALPRPWRPCSNRATRRAAAVIALTINRRLRLT